MVLTIPDGDRGVETTVRYIGRFVQSAVRSPEINRLAIEILRGANAPEHNPRAEAKAIFKWVRRNIRFVAESEETLRPVEEILRVQAGDCDDINGILLPSLLLSVGIPVRLVTVAVEPDAPKAFSHIYAEAFLDGEWVAMDAARPGARFGRAPEHYFRKRIWNITGEEHKDIRGVRSLNGYRRRGLGFDFSALTNLVQAGTTGAAQILASSKTGIPPMPLSYGLTPAVSSQILPGYTPVPTTGLLGGVSGGTVLLLLAGVGIFLVARKTK